ncbi:MAG: HD domain-containing phosphohydrolase [Armatimonadota bacterium]
MADTSPENKQQMSEAHSEVCPAFLLAAVPYLIDIVPSGCIYHGWRIALVAEHITHAICPDEAAEVFYAGLLQEVGTVGASKHITSYVTLQEQIEDHVILTHPRRGAALLDWLPGMEASARLVRYHHEWWDGGGYQDGRGGMDIPPASQLLQLVETMDTVGCFTSWPAMSAGLRKLARFTNHAWNKETWVNTIQSLEDSKFYSQIMNPELLRSMITDRLKKHPLPSELDNEAGVERIFHVFAALVDAKDPTTAGHSHRTALYAKTLAEHMGLSAEEARRAYRAGLVHDCGRLGVPTALLKRQGKLSDDEMEIVRQHAQMTKRALSCMAECPEMAEIGEVAGCDHERYDGTGYPDRLVGDHIPLISRILSVADSFDAMTAPTSYKNRLSPRFAVIRIQQASGTQFDPLIVEAMTSAVETRVLQVSQSAAA